MSLTAHVLAKFGPEDREHRRVILHCEAEGILIWHVPNEMYTDKPMVKIRNKLLGVRPGVADLFFVANNTLGVIEMKSLDGSATKAQKEFINVMRAAGIPSIIARGADVAIEFIEQIRAGMIPPESLQPLMRAPRKPRGPKLIDTIDDSPF